MKLLVQNSVVPRADFGNGRFSEKFQSYLGEDAEPLRHQAEASEHILNGRAVRLVAGTASGKTLAVALPLFEKLERGEIEKVLFFYPTLALMEDQKQVMDRLRDIYDSREPVGTIRGGMPRSSLVDALGKRVIVATPDAAYWFLRKNVKYSHLLIYGLLLADEIVVDEAHLFAGLSAQNLAAFLDRLRELRTRYLGAATRVHLLTATWPEDGTLEGLSPEARPVTGDSLVGDVSLEVLRLDTPRERSEAARQAALNLLDAGCKKILLVSNSARTAHAMFDSMTGAGAGARRPASVPDEFKLRFGMLEAREALRIARDAGLSKMAEAGLREEVPLRARRVKKAIEVELRAEVVVAAYGDLLERTVRELKAGAWRIARSGEEISTASLEIWMGVEALGRLEELGVAGSYAEYRAFRGSIESAANLAQEKVEESMRNSEGERGVRTRLPDMLEIEAKLRDAPMSSEFLREFRRGLLVSGETAHVIEELPLEAYRGVKIPIARFMGWFDEVNRTKLEPGVLDKAEHRAVRRIRSGEDGAISILYSGSIPRYAREGLIPLFEDLEVPVVLVSTSAVEVGVDFDADALVTEQCSGSSFLQRFGRVGRHSTGAQAKLLAGAESREALRRELGNRRVVNRREFSEAVSRALPERLFLRESRYVKAAQRTVTYQTGEVGREAAGEDAAVESLLEELQRAGVDLSYGLRGTMPGVRLREGVSKGPFYALRFADTEQILPPDSPFDLARLDRSFDEIIYTSRQDQRDVFVDLERTWSFLRSMAYLDGANGLKLTPVPGAWADAAGLKKTLSQVRYLRAKMGAVPPEVLDVLGQRIAGLPAGALTHPEALLFYGDVVLGMRAADRDDRTEPVPYRLQDQWVLLLSVEDAESAEDLLAEHGVANLEEMFYDRDGLKHANGTEGALGLVILEKQAGACLAAWERVIGE